MGAGGGGTGHAFEPGQRFVDLPPSLRERAEVRVDSGGKNTAFAQAGNLGWQTYGRCNRRALCRYPRPGFAPAGEALFFVSSPYISPKKSAPKKGDPTGCVPSLRCGQPAVLASSGVSLKLALCKRSNSRKPLSAGRSAPRRRQTGGGSQEAKTPKPETRNQKPEQPTTEQPGKPTRPSTGAIPALHLRRKQPHRPGALL